LCREPLIRFGAPGQGGKTGFGESGARIGRELVGHLLIAAVDQDVGDDLLQSRTTGYRQQVPLALGLGDFDEVGCCQPGRLDEDGAGDGDLIMMRKPTDHVPRCSIDWRDPFTEFRERSRLDSFDQATQNVVEYADLLLVEPVGAAEKKIGHAPQRFDSFVARARLNGFFELGNQ
jgi:hypothetical protein